MRILLAEDGLVNQKVAIDLLTRRGHSVDLAQNGKEAVEAAARNSYDVVLMDMHMPVMDGVAAAKAIRAKEQAEGGRLPIIACTASVTPADRERCANAGMDDFVGKPFRAGALLKAVEQAVSGTVPAQPAAAATKPEGGAPAAGEMPAGESADAAPDLAGAGIAPVDWQDALANLGNEELLREMAEIFLSQVPGLVEDLETARRTGNAGDLRRAAHTLKGSALVVSAHPLAEAAFRLENLARDGRLEELLPAQRELEDKLEHCKSALKAILAGAKPPPGLSEGSKPP